MIQLPLFRMFFNADSNWLNVGMKAHCTATYVGYDGSFLGLTVERVDDLFLLSEIEVSNAAW